MPEREVSVTQFVGMAANEFMRRAAIRAREKGLSPDQFKAKQRDLERNFAIWMLEHGKENFDLNESVTMAALVQNKISPEGVWMGEDEEQQRRIAAQVQAVSMKAQYKRRPLPVQQQVTEAAKWSMGMPSMMTGQVPLTPHQSSLIMDGTQVWLSSKLMPVFDEAAKELRDEDPAAYNALYFDLPLYREETQNMLGVKELDAVLPKWAAEIVAYDLFDPMNVVTTATLGAGGLPIAVQGGMGAFRSARFGLRAGKATTKLGWELIRDFGALRQEVLNKGATISGKAASAVIDYRERVAQKLMGTRSPVRVRKPDAEAARREAGMVAAVGRRVKAGAPPDEYNPISTKEARAGGVRTDNPNKFVYVRTKDLVGMVEEHGRQGWSGQKAWPSNRKIPWKEIFLRPLSSRGMYKGNPVEFDKLRNSIKAHGIKNPIALDLAQDGGLSISDGTHRLLIARKLGMEHVPVQFTPNFIERGGIGRFAGQWLKRSRQSIDAMTAEQQRAVGVVGRAMERGRKAKTYFESAAQVGRSLESLAYRYMVKNEIPPWFRAHMAEWWLDSTPNPDEVFAIQKWLAKYDPDIDAGTLLRRTRSDFAFWDPTKKAVRSLRLGAETQMARTIYHEDPKGGFLYYWLRNLPNGGQKVVIKPPFEKLLTPKQVWEYRRLRPIGTRGTLWHRINSAREQLRATRGGFVQAMNQPWYKTGGSNDWSKRVANMLRKARLGRHASESTGIVDAFVDMSEHMNKSITATRMRLNNIFGGAIHDTIHANQRVNSLLINNNPLGLKVAKVAPLLKRGKSLMTPGGWKELLKPKPVDPQLLDEMHQIYAALGGRQAELLIRYIRRKMNLPVHKMYTPSEDVKQQIEMLRAEFNRMFDLAREYNLLTPYEFLEDYVPLLSRYVDSGLSFTEAVTRANAKYGDRALVFFERQPFFSFMRNGMKDPTSLITDVAELVMRYETALQKHIHLRPLAEDALAIAGDARARLHDSERLQIIEYVMQQLGKGSMDSVALAAEISRGKAALAELAIPERMSTEVDDTFRWLNQQLSSMYMVNLLGFKLGAAARNITQQMMIPNYLGGTARGFKHYATGLVRYDEGDEAIRAGMRKGIARNGWLKAVDELAVKEFDRDIGTYLSNDKGFIGRLTARDVIPKPFQDAALLLYTGADARNRVAAFSGAWDFFENATEAEIKKSLRKFREVDRARVLDRMRAGDLAEAKQVFSEAVVNNTQFLYNRYNRPLYYQKVGDVPVLGHALLFASWTGNYLEDFARVSMADVRGLKWNKKGQQMIANAIDHQAAMIGVGMALEGIGRGTGIGSLGRWLFPTMSDLRAGGVPLTSQEYREEYGDYVLPIPFVKSALALINPTMTIRNLSDGADAMSILADGLINDESGAMASAFQSLYSASPFRPLYLDPIHGLVGTEMGVEPETYDREGMDILRGAVAFPSGREYGWRMWKASQGFPQPFTEE